MLGNFLPRSTDHTQHVNKKQNFLACTNKKQNVEAYKSASSRGQEKHIKCVTFLLFPLEGILLIFNFSLFVINQCFEKELIKKSRLPSMTKYKSSKQSFGYFSRS